MTREECKAALERLAEHWQRPLSSPFIDGLMDRFGHVDATVWRETVKDLIFNHLAPPHGMLDAVVRALDRVTDAQRQQRVTHGNRQATRWFAGATPIAGPTEEERAYNRFRFDLLRRSLASSPLAPETHVSGGVVVRQQDRTVARLHAEALGEWLQDDSHIAWASTVPQGDCGLHRGSHTLLQCLVDEQRYWLERAAGRSEAEARTLIVGVLA